MAATEAETTRVNEQGQVTLPPAIRAAARVEPDMEFTVEALPDRSIVLRPARDPDQWWFWTDRWRQMEREADASIAAGRVRQFMSDEEFLQALEVLDEDRDRANV